MIIWLPKTYRRFRLYLTHRSCSISLRPTPIFHNWPDKYCIKILRSLIPVLGPGAKIMINDSVMPGLGTLPWDREAVQGK